MSITFNRAGMRIDWGSGSEKQFWIYLWPWVGRRAQQIEESKDA